MEHHTFSYFNSVGKLGYILIQRSELRRDEIVLIGRCLDLFTTSGFEDKFPPELNLMEEIRIEKNNIRASGGLLKISVTNSQCTGPSLLNHQYAF